VLVWTTLRIAVKPLDLAVPTSQTDVVEATDSKPATIFPALDLVVAVIGIAVIAIGTTVSGMIVVFEHIRIGIGSVSYCAPRRKRGRRRSRSRSRRRFDETPFLPPHEYPLLAQPPHLTLTDQPPH